MTNFLIHMIILWVTLTNIICITHKADCIFGLKYFLILSAIFNHIFIPWFYYYLLEFLCTFVFLILAKYLYVILVCNYFVKLLIITSDFSSSDNMQTGAVQLRKGRHRRTRSHRLHQQNLVRPSESRQNLTQNSCLRRWYLRSVPPRTRSPVDAGASFPLIHNFTPIINFVFVFFIYSGKERIPQRVLDRWRLQWCIDTQQKGANGDERQGALRSGSPLSICRWGEWIVC